MKSIFCKKLFFSAAVLSIAAFSFVSCSDDPDKEHSVELGYVAGDYDANGVWSDAYTDIPTIIGNFVFSHTATDYGDFKVWNGFVPSKMFNTKNQSYWYGEYQFSVISGGGQNGPGTPFLMGFWDTQETDNTPWQERSLSVQYKENGEYMTFVPQGVYVNNSCVGYYTMRDGNDFSKPFDKGAWFKIHAYGVKKDGTTTGPVDYSLANCNSDQKDKWFTTTWEWFDLKGLGEVQAVYFTMTSSDNGTYGMNTPAYVGMDGFQVKL